MTKEGRDKVIVDEMAQAEEYLAVAAVERGAGFHKRCVSSCYYAAFHGARACLGKLNVEARSHAGAQNLFSQHLVQTGNFATSDSRLLKRMQKAREEADYANFTGFTETQSAETLRMAAEFLARVKLFLAK